MADFLYPVIRDTLCCVSVNYLHWGEAKRWYSVPASAADAFEGAFRSALPELFEKQPDVLFHLVTMLSPRILQAANVPVYGISQVESHICHVCCLQATYPRFDLLRCARILCCRTVCQRQNDLDGQQ